MIYWIEACICTIKWGEEWKNMNALIHSLEMLAQGLGHGLQRAITKAICICN